MCECEAMTATSFALPDARCALMKMRMLARAAERDNVDSRCAQACGFVSSTIVSSDGGGAVCSVSDASLRSRSRRPDPLRSSSDDLSHRYCSFCLFVNGSACWNFSDELQQSYTQPHTWQHLRGCGTW